MNYPCKNCEDRKIGCHDKCSKYQSMKQKRDAVLDNRQKDSEAVNWTNFIHTRAIRYQINHGRKR